LGQEKKRLKRSEKKVTRRSLGPFAIWGRFLLVFGPLSLTAIILASYFTPLFAIQNIVITGTERVDASVIQKRMDPLLGRPLPTVSETELTEILRDYPLIETFTFQAQPPGTLRIKLRERQPVVVLNRAGQNYLYDAAGVQIAISTQTKAHPFLVLIGDPANNPRFDAAIELLLALPLDTYGKVFSIEMTPQLTAKLVLRDSNTVVLWGDSGQSLFKSEVLFSLIATGVEDGVLIDVSSPNAPVVTYPDF
jgi:cell division protein FtsQ